MLIAGPLPAQAATCPTVDAATLSVAPAPSAGVNWRRCTLTGADLSSADLSGANLAGARLWGANLGGADLSGATLLYASLRGASLDSANLNAANLTGANLTTADLSAANLTGATLTGSRSGGLVGTPLQLPPDWSIVKGYLVGPGANLRSADLNGADLDEVNLSGADLTGADLDGADLDGADLGALRSGAIVGTPLSLPGGWQLVQGYLVGPGAFLQYANLEGASLPNARLARANLSGANLTNANLSGADLVDANLNSANLTNTNLSGADLTNASLGVRNLSGADLTGADLTGAYLGEANLSDADLTDADLTGAYLFMAEGCSIIGGGTSTLPPAYAIAGGCLVQVTTLTAKASPTSVPYGSTTVLTGALRLKTGLGLSARPIKILAKPQGATSWTTIGTSTTVDFAPGNFQAWPTPRSNTYYMAQFAGDSGLGGASSAPVLITVKPKVSFTLNDSTTTRTRTVYFSGTVSPNAKYQTVYLQRFASGNWSNVKSMPLHSTSSYKFAWKPASSIDYSFRVYVPARKGYLATTTATKKLTVA